MAEGGKEPPDLADEGTDGKDASDDQMEEPNCPTATSRHEGPNADSFSENAGIFFVKTTTGSPSLPPPGSRAEAGNQANNTSDADTYSVSQKETTRNSRPRGDEEGRTTGERQSPLQLLGKQLGEKPRDQNVTLLGKSGGAFGADSLPPTARDGKVYRVDAGYGQCPQTVQGQPYERIHSNPKQGERDEGETAKEPLSGQPADVTDQSPQHLAERTSGRKPRNVTENSEDPASHNATESNDPRGQEIQKARESNSEKTAEVGDSTRQETAEDRDSRSEVTAEDRDTTRQETAEDRDTTRQETAEDRDTTRQETAEDRDTTRQETAGERDSRSEVTAEVSDPSSHRAVEVSHLRPEETGQATDTGRSTEQNAQNEDALNESVDTGSILDLPPYYRIHCSGGSRRFGTHDDHSSQPPTASDPQSSASQPAPSPLSDDSEPQPSAQTEGGLSSQDTSDFPVPPPASPQPERDLRSPACPHLGAAAHLQTPRHPIQVLPSTTTPVPQPEQPQVPGLSRHGESPGRGGVGGDGGQQEEEEEGGGGRRNVGAAAPHAAVDAVTLRQRQYQENSAENSESPVVVDLRHKTVDPGDIRDLPPDTESDISLHAYDQPTEIRGASGITFRPEFFGSDPEYARQFPVFQRILDASLMDQILQMLASRHGELEQQQQQQQRHTICVVCETSTVNVATLPCGHRVVCRHCLLCRRLTNCPVHFCRQAIHYYWIIRD